MILIYAFLCWLIFSYYGSKLVEALRLLHVGLIKASMFKEYRKFTKSASSMPLFSKKFTHYPKTWRSLWTELVLEGENPEVMANLAIKTGLPDYCLKSKTQDLGLQVENISVLCLVNDLEARSAYLASLAEGSKVWTLPLSPHCFRHGDVAQIYIQRLLSSDKPRGASHIIAMIEPSSIHHVLLQICGVNSTYQNFAVRAATQLEGIYQRDFILAAKSLGVSEIPFIKYFSRFNQESQEVIRTLYPNSSWWYSRLVLGKEGDKFKPPPHIAWFYNKNEKNLDSPSNPKDLPEIHIAA
jgi:hypothetical protein